MKDLAPAIAALPSAEQAAIAQLNARAEARSPTPRLSPKETKDGAQTVAIDHENPTLGGLLLTAALGGVSTAFVAPFLGQLMNAISSGRALDASTLNYALELVKGVEPRNELEAMLAAQMTATHFAAMKQLERLSEAQNAEQIEIYERAASRLMRSFAKQTEALRKLRSGGEQKVEVRHVHLRHVHVSDGGQAIIGAIEGGGGARKT